MMRQLREIIAGREPLILPQTTTVQAACQQMTERRTGSILITDANDKLIGIFTGRDAVHRVLAVDKSAGQTTLGDVMTADPMTLSPNATAIEALRLMWDRGFRHVPVVDGSNLLGVISTGDIEGLELDLHEYERLFWEKT